MHITTGLFSSVLTARDRRLTVDILADNARFSHQSGVGPTHDKEIRQPKTDDRMSLQILVSNPRSVLHYRVQARSHD
jgi:hypothetical protein